jgi:hypothetical protein
MMTSRRSEGVRRRVGPESTLGQVVRTLGARCSWAFGDAAGATAGTGSDSQMWQRSDPLSEFFALRWVWSLGRPLRVDYWLSWLVVGDSARVRRCPRTVADGSHRVSVRASEILDLLASSV